MRNPKMHLCLVFLFAICVIPSTALATLMQITEDGESLVSDTSSGMVWIADMDQFTNMSYTQVGQTIEQLNQDSYGGINTWGLATRRQVRNLFDSVEGVTEAAMFDTTYTYTSGYYGSWGITSSTFELDDGTEVYYAPWLERYTPGYPNWLDWGYGRKYPSDGGADPEIGAWVTSVSPVVTSASPVPEPMTILLLGPGMMALALFKRRFWRT